MVKGTKEYLLDYFPKLLQSHHPKSQDTGTHPSPYNLQSITPESHPSAVIAETNQRKLQENEPTNDGTSKI